MVSNRSLLLLMSSSVMASENVSPSKIEEHPAGKIDRSSSVMASENVSPSKIEEHPAGEIVHPTEAVSPCKSPLRKILFRMPFVQTGDGKPPQQPKAFLSPLVMKQIPFTKKNSHPNHPSFLSPSVSENGSNFAYKPKKTNPKRKITDDDSAPEESSIERLDISDDAW